VKQKISKTNAFLLICCFLFSNLYLPSNVFAQLSANLAQTNYLFVTPAFMPTIIKGMTISLENPLKFDFIVDSGEESLSGQEFEQESQKLIKYFLASITVPESDLWVNLSPYEKNRIIADSFGKTEMGRDLLAQDYILKKLTASLMLPENELGDNFWGKMRAKYADKLGDKDLNMDALNKIWIVPSKAVVYEHGTSVFVVESHLKVMLEEEYNEMMAQEGLTKKSDGSSESMSSLIKELIVPEIEKEVNEGKHFANLRQIYNSMILATWYKQNLKNSLLAQVYSDQNKIKGVDLKDEKAAEKIYNQYLDVFKQGVANYIREEYDENTQQVLSIKYFTGGTDFDVLPEVIQKHPLSNKDTSMLSIAEIEVVRSLMEVINSSGRQQMVVSADMVENLGEGLNVRVADPELEKLLWNYSPASNNSVVVDESLEAFFTHLGPIMDKTRGKGGLGFLQGETYNNYEALFNQGIAPLPVTPRYFTLNGAPVDWERQVKEKPFMIYNNAGQIEHLAFNVDFNGGSYPVRIYWANTNGVLSLAIESMEGVSDGQDISKNKFRTLYPSGDEQDVQMAFFARAFVETMKKLGIRPDIVRLSEGQLFFTSVAMDNDVNYFKNANSSEKSVFENTEVVFTTHTPELAALPKWERWDVGHLWSLVGRDLVPDSVIDKSDPDRWVVNAAKTLAAKAIIINSVSREHQDVTIQEILPDSANKVVAIQNGSDPRQWYSPALEALVDEVGIHGIEGEQLFNIVKQNKQQLNEHLRKKYGKEFTDPDLMLVGLVRRLVEYKAQGMLIPMAKWITGDKDTDYDTPWLGEGEKRKGLNSNILIGGPSPDTAGQSWAEQFAAMENDPALKGKFIFINESDIELMQKSVQSADVWLVLPYLTREASGTSDERAEFNGNLVIATATGGPLSYITHGVNGWLINPFKGWSQNEVIKRFQIQDQAIKDKFYADGARELGQYLIEAVNLRSNYIDNGDQSWLNMMKAAFNASHKKVSIKRMVEHYGLLFKAALRKRKYGESSAEIKVWFDKQQKNLDIAQDVLFEAQSMVEDFSLEDLNAKVGMGMGEDRLIEFMNLLGIEQFAGDNGEVVFKADSVPVLADAAVLGDENDNKKVGGINLNPSLLNLQIKRDDQGVPLPFSDQPLKQMNIEGFYPVIINIQPLNSLPLLLGVDASSEKSLELGLVY